ncbi:uncharacterized protein F5891DRAFT_987233 [Suillus fuscotomentosus]|uniref:Uncharacterized protein n=1 Tax=Suillus fuscotomentosus TaxID=1912939 RepID=A0AAD4HE18_9AGAM|nr:uncharacterized protein F5891DRAFT_987233 [Suillus fuscotomentosus]KAG1889764.1 hypothetical protein F5891DRAFT_987233 [Suillus fuscotomentosus]
MTRLHADPNSEQCPDFASAEFQSSRAPLLSPTSDDAQAAATLRTIWTATNATLKAKWQLQLDAEALELTEQQRLRDEAEAQRLEAQAQLDATTADEDRKKNRIHHIPIPSRPRPKRAAESFLVSDFALRKLDKAQFVELYYWTNKGLADARLNFLTTDDDSMVPSAAADGSTSWIAASVARPAAGVIADHLLAPLDFSRAIPRFIASLEQRGWEDSRIVMLANFFGALMLHNYWCSDNALEQRALLAYEEDQRRAWHQAIPLASGAWDISILDETEISQTFDRLYHSERDRADREFDLKIFIIPCL